MTTKSERRTESITPEEIVKYLKINIRVSENLEIDIKSVDMKNYYSGKIKTLKDVLGFIEENIIVEEKEEDE